MALFNKYFHPANFDFSHRWDGDALVAGGRKLRLRISHGPGIQHLEVVDPRLWRHDHRREPFTLPTGGPFGEGPVSELTVSDGAGMQLRDAKGKCLLSAPEGAWFGICGERWLFQFHLQSGMRFYGLGEKHVPFQRPERGYRFRNTDVWADHCPDIVARGDYDPDYLSIPYLIIKQNNTYIGLLVDTPYPAQVAMGPTGPRNTLPPALPGEPPVILLGAGNGPASLYVLYGPSLPELTRRLQKLVGPTPLPPLWALGYHQCRWGYKGHEDLMQLAERFERHLFPADGLWLDIDYMDGFRIFTFNRHHLPNPAETTAAISRNGFRVIAIIDPGVKRERGFAVYENGRSEGVFCLNPAGRPFTGIAWPGWVVFPDFSLPKTARWWGRYVKRLLAAGFEGFWLDMNEPSTGPVDEADMRFQYGRTDHDAYHNQYALLMAKATREAMLEAQPERRPFLLSRSGCTGSQRYCAHWTGDNISSYRHLHRAIGKTLNLALSGIPFNGPDVGGFGGDCGEALLVDWFKSAFLFPFFRNHSMYGSRAQEPWAYSPEALDILRHYVRLRYRLMPYLYNLFIDQEERGEAILRPLFYDFADTAGLPLASIDDQFMVGPAIMQAPFVQPDNRHREVALPDGDWLRADTGAWIQGGRRLRVARSAQATPLFVRAGAIIPFQTETPVDNRCDLADIGLLCGLPLNFRGRTGYRYRADDGITFQYRHGRRTVLDITARVEARQLHLSLHTLADGFGPIAVRPYTVNRFARLYLEANGTTQRLRAVRTSVRLTGRSLTCYRWHED